MANPQLTVEIGGDLTNLGKALNKGVSDVEKASNQMSASANKADASFDKLAKDVDNSMKSIGNSTNKASNDVSKNLAKVAQQSANTDRAIKASGTNFQGFSRVLQDVAFGPGAIANNLEGLGNDFRQIGQIAKESGRSIGSVLVSSLTGAGGLNLALGGLTLGLSLASFGLNAWTRLFGDNKKAVDDANKSTKDYIDTLDGVRAAQLKGIQNSQQDIVNLRLLYKAYTDANRPLKERQEAYKQLQDKYPAYFGNLKFEETASNATKAAYDRLTVSIIATARARAASDIITKNATRQLENQQKIVDLEREQIDNQKEFNKLVKQGAGEIGAAERGQGDLSQTARLISLEKRIKENIKDRQNLVTDTNKLTEQNIRLEKLATDNIVKGTVATEKSTEAIKARNKELEKTNTNILAPNAGQSLIPDAQNRLNNRPTPEAQIVQRFKPPKGLTEYEKLVNAAVASNDRFIESINNVGTATLTSGIGDAFAAIGDAFANGTNAIEGFGNAIISAFAGFLNQLGQMFIKEGIAQIGYGIAKNLILPGSGANNISGGLGMIAAGAAISVVGGAAGAKARGRGAQGNDVKPIRQFATGGYNLPAGMALVGERGPEIVNLPTGSSVFNNAKTERLIGNGSTNINLTGQLGIEMGTLYFALKNYEKELNR